MQMSSRQAIWKKICNSNLWTVYDMKLELIALCAINIHACRIIFPVHDDVARPRVSK